MYVLPTVVPKRCIEFSSSNYRCTVVVCVVVESKYGNRSHYKRNRRRRRSKVLSEGNVIVDLALVIPVEILGVCDAMYSYWHRCTIPLLLSVGIALSVSSFCHSILLVSFVIACPGWCRYNQSSSLLFPGLA